LKKMIRSFFF